MSTYPTLGSILRRRREELHLTQAQILKRISGLQLYYLQVLEEDGAHNFIEEFLKKLAKVLKLPYPLLYLAAHPELREVFSFDTDYRIEVDEQPHSGLREVSEDTALCAGCDFSHEEIARAGRIFAHEFPGRIVSKVEAVAFLFSLRRF